MLGRIHCLFPQALVVALVVATLMVMQRRKRAHKPQRLGTMLWTYIFAMTLELSYSICLLGRVECPVPLWYGYCAVLGILGFAVLSRDLLIDSTVGELSRDEEGFAHASAAHRSRSIAAIVCCGVLTAVASVLPVWSAGQTALSDHLPFIAAGLALPAVFMVLSRGNGLASALVSILLFAIGASRAECFAAGRPFVLTEDLPAFFSSLIGGTGAFAFTPATVISILLTGAAIALCAILFRLPKVIRAAEEPAAEEPDAEALPEAADADAEALEDGAEAVEESAAEEDGSSMQEA